MDYLENRVFLCSGIILNSISLFRDYLEQYFFAQGLFCTKAVSFCQKAPSFHENLKSKDTGSVL